MDATSCATPICSAWSTSFPASRTVLLKLDGPRYQGAARQQLSKLRLTPEAVEEATAPIDGRADVVIDVVYDGADLDEVGKLTGLSRQDIVTAHTQTPWRVGFGGFAPGFAYLVGGDERLNVPRRSEPRTKVPDGSVGLAGEFSGVYPRESPGGWQLIGHTSKDRRPVGCRPRAARTADAGSVGSVPGGVIVTTTTPGGAAHRSAGADRRPRPVGQWPTSASPGPERPTAASHTLANRLVANPGDRATIEVTFGGFSARVRGGDVAIAVTGADTDPAVNGVPFGTNSIHHAHDGEVISLGAPHSGLRTYLAVRGGIDVAPVLGSRSYDVMSAIGPQPLQPGDVLPIGDHAEEFPELDQAPVAAIEEDVVELSVVPGPRDDWFTDPDVLVHTNWQVTNRSDRVGMRLVGMPLEYRWRRPPAAQRGRHPRCDSGAAERFSGHSRSRPPGHRRLPGDRGGDRRGHRPDRADPAGADRPSALVTPAQALSQRFQLNG